VCGDIISEASPTPLLRVVVAPVKGDRTDLVVEKLVEIGVDNISILAPVERSVVRWAQDKTSHVMDRYQRIARAAAMQSRRVFLPDVVGPVSLGDVGTSGVAFAEPDGSAGWDNVTTVVIGPEGGFSEAELSLAPATIDLGPTILRAETRCHRGCVTDGRTLAALNAPHWVVPWLHYLTTNFCTIHHSRALSANVSDEFDSRSNGRCQMWKRRAIVNSRHQCLAPTSAESAQFRFRV